jgi:hypothetical protein
MAIETNGGRTGKIGVIFLLFIDEAQAAWDSPEHLFIDEAQAAWDSPKHLYTLYIY